MPPRQPPTRSRTCLSALPHPDLGPTFSIFAVPTLFSQRTDVLSPLPSPLGGRCRTPSPLHVSLHLLLRGCAHHLILCDSGGVRLRHGQSQACPLVIKSPVGASSSFTQNGGASQGPLVPFVFPARSLLRICTGRPASHLAVRTSVSCSLVEQPAPCFWGGCPACYLWPGCGFSTFRPPTTQASGKVSAASACPPPWVQPGAPTASAHHLGWNWVFCKCAEES